MNNHKWYEVLGNCCDKAEQTGVATAVEAINASGIVDGVLSAANTTAFAPIGVLLQGMLDAARGAAAARDDLIELVAYCIRISKYLIESIETDILSTPIADQLESLEEEILRVTKFATTYNGRRAGGCCMLIYQDHDNETIAGYKDKLLDCLEITTVGCTIERLVPQKPLRDIVKIPTGTLALPQTYVKRVIFDTVLSNLTGDEHKASPMHCLWGAAGIGKSLLASKLVHHEDTRSAFTGGVFWLSVGAIDKSKMPLLFEQLAFQFNVASSGDENVRSDWFGTADEVIAYLKKAKGDARCLLVLDDVRDVEVVDAFGSTRFHLLITTRDRSVVSSSRYAGVETEVEKMTETEALELLGNASGATGQILPESEAKQVATHCKMLPLTLSMAGKLAEKNPLASTTWQTVHRVLDTKRTEFRARGVREEAAGVFSVIEAVYENLASTPKENFELLGIMATQAPATLPMLSNLWELLDNSDTKVQANVLVKCCLLHQMFEPEIYGLHGYVQDYLQRQFRHNQDILQRQACYLSRLHVLHSYSSNAGYSGGGLHSLAALWESIERIDRQLCVNEYNESLVGVLDCEYPWREAGNLLRHLNKYEEAIPKLEKAVKIGSTTLGEDAECTLTSKKLLDMMRENVKSSSRGNP